METWYGKIITDGRGSSSEQLSFLFKFVFGSSLPAGGADDDKSSRMLLEENLICLHCKQLSISGVGKTPQETQIKAGF